MADVQAKLLVVWGSNDQIFDVSCLYEVRRLLPQASICIIEDAGHVPYLECAEQTLQAIQRFLAGTQAVAGPV
ncbi:alpha/beta hydrolase [Pseudomonas orientalis]|uniref:alpha/beta fold hydrolase n=1 Tax=Pseudomonas orientalis TaxID=76758 RepID=UPI0030B92E2B